MPPLNSIPRSTFTAAGDLIYGSGANTPARLAGNTTAVRTFLSQTGNGSAAGPPAWIVLEGSDIPQVPGSILGSHWNNDATNNTTASTSPVDLGTVQEISFTLARNSIVLFLCSAGCANNGTNTDRLDIWDGTSNHRVVRMGCDSAGANYAGSGQLHLALAAGTHTFRLRFSVTGGTGTFLNRCITAFLARFND